MDPAIEPLMAEFGAAVHDAQVLERCIELIIALLDAGRETGEELPSSALLFRADGKVALGALINALRKRVSLDPAFSDELEATLKLRNHLVHAFFKDEIRLNATLTPSGTAGLIVELRDVRARVKGTLSTLEQIFDSLLKRQGMSLEAVFLHAKKKLEEASRAESSATKH